MLLYKYRMSVEFEQNWDCEHSSKRPEDC